MSRIYSAGVEDGIRKLESPDRRKRHDPEFVFKRAGLSSGMRVADLGCGTGFWAMPAAQIVGEKGFVYAIDRVPDVLQVLRAKVEQSGFSNIRVMQGDLESPIDIPSGSIDFVLIACVLHDVRSKVLPEILRILGESGRLCIVERKKESTTENGPPREERMTSQEAINLIGENGLRALDTFDDIAGTHYVLVAQKAKPPASSSS